MQTTLWDLAPPPPPPAPVAEEDPAELRERLVAWLVAAGSASRREVADALGLSVHQARGALEVLSATGRVVVGTRGRYEVPDVWRSLRRVEWLAREVGAYLEEVDRAERWGDVDLEGRLAADVLEVLSEGERTCAEVGGALSVGVCEVTEAAVLAVAVELAAAGRVEVVEAGGVRRLRRTT